jgi:hypothetical protein
MEAYIVENTDYDIIVTQRDMDTGIEQEMITIDKKTGLIVKVLNVAIDCGVKSTLYIKFEYASDNKPKRIIWATKNIEEGLPLIIANYKYDERGELKEYEDTEGNWWDSKVVTIPLPLEMQQWYRAFFNLIIWFRGLYDFHSFSDDREEGLVGSYLAKNNQYMKETFPNSKIIF